MEHWFDRLSRLQTRRTMLKGAVAAGAAVAVPALRLPNAWATPDEPCFKPCNIAAVTKWNSTLTSGGPGGCKEGPLHGLLGSVLTGPVSGAVLVVIGLAREASCHSSAELTYHRDALACRGSDCGDPGTYPFGTVPGPKAHCDPAQEIACGNTCCNNLDKCCQCQADGAYICCSAGSPCEPTPDRGGCCVGH